MVGSFEHCKESLGSIKCKEFLDQLSDYYLQEALCTMELFMEWIDMIKTGV
jgi:hypothetical protein